MAQILKMTTEHIKDVHKIEEDCFSIPWSEKSFYDEITKNKMAIYIVAKQDDEIIGYGGMWHVINEGHITNVAVKKEHRGKGIGKQIITALIDIAKEKEMIGITLEVRVSNNIAKALYKQNGFIIEGIRKEYYDDNREDAIVMWKHL
ncbi:ribosomal protein S18-alanine N-acetyltransferase [uncultured Tyzzerella sp.]|uniref:ribosomal protein S18-alanine N-acetyltransferase n=1 Tax=uncultured Tyzzerella sp. TaxID=2321398 RepID=UPI002943BB95|nr:ribosomal protein S18-alanine N-acetyltransferase [uncultured Tyzzerella sp.]